MATAWRSASTTTARPWSPTWSRASSRTSSGSSTTTPRWSDSFKRPPGSTWWSPPPPPSDTMPRLRIQHPLPGMPLSPQVLNYPAGRVVSCEGRLCALVGGMRVWLEEPPAEAREDLSRVR
ncbi:hypothetical protein S2L_04 [Cyanophage S-2L]|nr:hypothetical protein S2L_04 [Cyanophage S-2L]